MSTPVYANVVARNSSASEYSSEYDSDLDEEERQFLAELLDHELLFDSQEEESGRIGSSSKA